MMHALLVVVEASLQTLVAALFVYGQLNSLQSSSHMFSAALEAVFYLGTRCVSTLRFCMGQSTSSYLKVTYFHR